MLKTLTQLYRNRLAKIGTATSGRYPKGSSGNEPTGEGKGQNEQKPPEVPHDIREVPEIKTELLRMSTLKVESGSQFFFKDGKLVGRWRDEKEFSDRRGVSIPIHDIIVKTKEYGADTVVSIHNHPFVSEDKLMASGNDERLHGILTNTLSNMTGAKLRSYIVLGNNKNTKGTNLKPVKLEEYDSQYSVAVYKMTMSEKELK